ncbi:hypothetical protein Cabther_B0791 [Chloracidobacterium thermophilum B]|uniref:Uncharacterized protein n=1 Tax=Chloracidobacterium thermophilum (strain B) TaxID=981222 RepID=G2LLJ2_CHLTF|nr:hypothetical protein Cabther_B0791 [Chloracidobacterium thermophilum B]
MLMSQTTKLKGRRAKLLKGITPVCGQCNLMTLFLQGLSNGLTNQWLVVNHQYPGGSQGSGLSR